MARETDLFKSRELQRLVKSGFGARHGLSLPGKDAVVALHEKFSYLPCVGSFQEFNPFGKAVYFFKQVYFFSPGSMLISFDTRSFQGCLP